ncbi:uncharacterized protein V1516DRAFT_675773 [Lipomyces oligophaga]|uniref:uncharacterized protein n=1 Tax=Lipomyces oligophaga TaxID=45792 RepID=UPI0034D00810
MLVFVFLVALVLLAIAYQRRRISRQTAETPREKQHKSGFYKDEAIPRPTPFPELTLSKLATYDDRPWRAFRWPYHQTMSIFKLDINHWLDMDKWYLRYITERMDIIRRTGDTYCACLPDGVDAAEELLDMVVDHMTTRYPSLFVRTATGVDNLITKEHINLTRPLVEPALHLVARIAKEDFYLVKRRPDGKHYLVAAVVPAPGGFFGVKDKVGKHIDQIHTEVPYYEEKLKVSMERWFGRMTASDPVERASWFICWDHELLCNSIYSLSDGEKVDPNTDFTKFNVRVCAQTLRRLPKTQAIIFSNHPIFYSIEEMKDEPFVPSILKKVILDGPEKILKYKGFEKFDEHLIPYIDSLIQRQIDLGIISADDPVRTRKAYPFADWYDPHKENHGEGYVNPYWAKYGITPPSPESVFAPGSLSPSTMQASLDTVS